jgi:hypothetical protein
MCGGRQVEDGGRRWTAAEDVLVAIASWTIVGVVVDVDEADGSAQTVAPRRMVARRRWLAVASPPRWQRCRLRQGGRRRSYGGAHTVAPWQMATCILWLAVASPPPVAHGECCSGFWVGERLEMAKRAARPSPSPVKRDLFWARPARHG